MAGCSVVRNLTLPQLRGTKEVGESLYLARNSTRGDLGLDSIWGDSKITGSLPPFSDTDASNSYPLGWKEQARVPPDKFDEADVCDDERTKRQPHRQWVIGRGMASNLPESNQFYG